VHSRLKQPLITLITVVRNARDTIGETINSVAGQEFRDFEYLVIDGASTDGTLGIIKAHDDVIDHWISEPDNGIYDAMNKGIRLARGQYIGLLNADDMFAGPEVLRTVADRIIETGVDAVFSSLEIVDRQSPDRVLRRYRIPYVSDNLLRIGIMPPHPTFYCRKSVLERAGLYRTDFRIAADFEMMVRLFVSQRISWSYIDFVSVIMRSGGLSNSGLRSRIRLNLEIVRACHDNSLYTNVFFILFKIPVRLIQSLT
jgi:glycosyltransferase involved in cell wall biosynthesis